MGAKYESVPIWTFIERWTPTIAFCALFALKLFIATGGFYVPDEFWQSIEVAHKLTFGYGYLTWEWQQGLRSYVYPAVFALFYKILAVLNLDTVTNLVNLPRLLHLLLSSYADYRFFIWTGKLRWALCMLACPFWVYIGGRTLINTLEASLTTIALSYFPWQQIHQWCLTNLQKTAKKEKMHKSENILANPHSYRVTGRRSLVSLHDARLDDTHSRNSNRKPLENPAIGYAWLVGLCCYLRPTAAPFWLPLLWQHITHTNSIARLIFAIIWPPILCIGMDWYFYGALTITPWNFFLYNWSKDVGSFYGTHPCYWYLIAGLPVLLGVYMLPFAYGVCRYCSSTESREDEKVKPGEMSASCKQYVQKQLLLAIAIELVALSLVPHKEHRFLAIMLPACLYIATQAMKTFSRNKSRFSICVIALLFAVCSLVPLYVARWYQQGPVTIMHKVQDIAHNYRDEQTGKRASIFFLMPCHSTPFYSHVHEQIEMRFLTCEPNLKNQQHYQDEADEFYANPRTWIKDFLQPNNARQPPTHFVFYDSLLPEIMFRIDEQGSRCALSPNGQCDYYYLDAVVDNWLSWINSYISAFVTIPAQSTRKGERIYIYERR